MKILFTDTVGISKEYAPKPASTMIPDWYKKTESYMGGEKTTNGYGAMTATVKRCMPVFDAISSGYFLVTHTDVSVKQIALDESNPDKKTPWFEWASLNAIQFHPIQQAPLHPSTTGSDIPKWINPWSIKTPKGYSSLFIAPMHHNNIFVALPGVVDTDTYTSPINIVFALADPNFAGLIPAGTPIAQVIPFKREKWNMGFGAKKELEEQFQVGVHLKSKFFDGYKTIFRQPKEYK
jgi:hypothetical protein